MKADQLTPELLLKIRGLINSGVSVPVINIAGVPYSVKTVTEYVSGYYSQLTNGEVLVPSNAPLPGVRSVDKNMLPAGVHQLVDSVRFLHEIPASGATTADNALIMAAAFASTPPACFKNGEVRFNQNAELLRTSGSDISNFRASTSNDDDFRQVVPFVLRGGAPISIKIVTAGTVVANYAFKLEWRALEFTPAPNA